MKPHLTSLWQWSWLITLPVAVLFVYWAGQTHNIYQNFCLRYDAVPIQFSLRGIGARNAKQMLLRARTELFEGGGRTSVGPGNLRLVSLFVQEGDIAHLNSNLPHSGFQEVDGKIWHGNQPIDCEVRYRGDFAQHWGYAKKSWRIKTKRSQLWEGMRKFNIIAPKYDEQLNNYFGYKLASQMGLIAPRTELVQLAVNGKLRGVHVLVEQLEELTLRANGYMPGDIYAGEMVSKDEYAGIFNAVFEHPRLWEKAAINNHYAIDHATPMVELTRLLNEWPSEETHAQLARLLNLEAWAKFSAFEALAQTWHFDAVHNWRIYWDANRGQFVPIVWDPIALSPYWRPEPKSETQADVVLTRLHTTLFQNGDFLRARQRAFEEFFSSGTDQACAAILENTLPKLRRALQSDALRKPTDLSVANAAANRFVASMNRVWGDLRQAYTGSEGGVRYAQHDGVFTLEVSGRRTVDSLELVFSRPLARLPAVEIRYHLDGRTVRRNLSGASRLTGNTLTINAGLLCTAYPFLKSRQNGLRNHRRRMRPAYYELVLDGGIPPTSSLFEMKFDRGKDTDQPATRVDQLPKEDLRGLFLAAPDLPHTTTVQWSGEMIIKGNTEVREDVLIAAGTRIRMAAGANIRFWGRVLAEGTAEAPIEFGPLIQGQAPWGVVTLQGRDTDSSRFTHCNFALGSGWKHPMWEYSAMFSVHDANDILVRNCRFQDSRVVDDMVHTVYSHVEFHGCQFDRALMDALDMDICTGKVNNCLFRNSGNDSLDLMTSKIVVDGTRILDSGDKGISVGENTLLFCRNVEFIRCVRGIEGKDSSQAYVYNSLFDANELAVNAYKKNWRYNNGGHVFLNKCRMVNSRGNIRADRSSSISLRDCYTDVPAKTRKRVSVDALTDSVDPARAREHAIEYMPKKLEAISHLVRPHFERINFSARGPSNGAH
ncbi:MAG: CotH kinase family protein [Planctomycetota bacterium]|nr:CotH kinase family protein [Planctomycetota bacterium]